MKYIYALLVMLLITSCGDEYVNIDSDDEYVNIDSDDDEYVNIDSNETTNLYKGSKYGKWLIIDNAKGVELTSTGIKYISSFNDEQKIDTLQEYDANIFKITTKDGKTHYMTRASIQSAKVSGSVANKIISQDTKALISYSSPTLTKSSVASIGSTSVILRNLADSKITHKVPAQEDGKFELSGVITGDYEMNVSSDTSETASVKISINDEINDVGILTLEKESNYNFKSELIVNNSYMYGYQGLVYEGKIRIKNIGKATAEALSFHFDANDSYIYDFDIENVTGSLDPGMYKDIPFTIRFKQLDDIQRTIKVAITIRDLNYKEWEDYVLFTVYKRPVKVSFRGLSSTIKGYISMPSGALRAINSSNSEIFLPFLPTKTYTLYLSNADLAGETTYSVGLDTFAKGTDFLEAFTDTGSFEPNNKESEAKTIQVGEVVTSYLHRGDLDIFRECSIFCVSIG